jgi:hypothetical protein
MEKWIDPNVERVSSLLKERMNKGFIKYGTTTERKDIDLVGWIQHLQEELLDAAVYAERLKQDYQQPSLNLEGMDSSITYGPDCITIVTSDSEDIKGLNYEFTTSSNSITINSK